MTRKMKKLALPAVALSMLAVASVPVLAQDGFENVLTEEAEAAEAAVDRTFPCGFLVSGYDNSTFCQEDEDGFYTTRSGVRFPVFGDDSAKNEASYIQYGGAPGGEGPLGPG